MKHRLRLAALLVPICLLCWHFHRHPRVGWKPAPLFPDGASWPTAEDASLVDYNRDIKPVLSATCYACHGPDDQSRQADLRLDLRSAAVRSAIVPGSAARSLLVAKVSSADEQERMPPPESHRPPLAPEQIDLIRRWIDQGARFEDHWSFAALSRPMPPAVKNAAWVRNPVDAFLAAGLEAHGLAPSPQADRRTLLRRLSLDLTGLPPTPEEADAFVNDPAPDAYERVVDRLLASPRFGERMAVAWLDLVRYADTEGYSVDADRKVWMYRDFVIAAFNRNEPFDRFTVRQLAGDLLPGAGPEDLIASGYNRLLMNSQEGCAEPEERRVKYQSDRVRNLCSAWLGLTMGCAECHDHKFDPLKQKEFYRLAAFFADIQEVAVGPQALKGFPDPRRGRVDELDRQLSQARAAWEARTHQDDYRGIPDNVASALRMPSDRRPPDQVALIERFFLQKAREAPAANRAVVEALADRARLRHDLPETLVTSSGPPRPVRVLRRGNWQDQSGEVVGPGTPAVLRLRVGHPGRPLSRLDLARWVVSPDNPLTARVLANRLWALAFGKGLVASADDFGAQGTAPTHPELLDWLAGRLARGGWDIKATLRLLVTSGAYRQSSEAGPELRERDPANLWLARQNRFRIDAEFIRDNTLAISGLLSERLGGPSAKPVQPDAYWADRYITKTYEPDAGPEAHRRGLYTFWCRNYLHPALALFDAPSRQACTGERMRSATPLQALALLNDPCVAEAARAFAGRVIREAPPDGRPDRAFRLALGRDATPAEAEVLRRLHAAEIDRFHEGSPVALTSHAPPTAADADPAELAAWTALCRVILNLKETVTRY